MCVVVQIALALLVGLTDQTVSLNPPITVVAPQSDSISQDLREHFDILAQRWMQAYNSSDSTVLASLYAQDAQYISSHVRVLSLRDATGS